MNSVKYPLPYRGNSKPLRLCGYPPNKLDSIENFTLLLNFKNGFTN